MPMPTATPSVVTAAIPATTRRFRLYCGFLCLAICWLPRFVCCSGELSPRAEAARRRPARRDQHASPGCSGTSVSACTSCAYITDSSCTRFTLASDWPALLACLSVVDAVDGLGHQLL